MIGPSDGQVWSAEVERRLAALEASQRSAFASNASSLLWAGRPKYYDGLTHDEIADGGTLPAVTVTGLAALVVCSWQITTWGTAPPFRGDRPVIYVTPVNGTPFLFQEMIGNDVLDWEPGLVAGVMTWPTIGPNTVRMEWSVEANPNWNGGSVPPGVGGPDVQIYNAGLVAIPLAQS